MTKGIYTSNELPHFINNMQFEIAGNPELGEILAKESKLQGVETLAHVDTTLNPEYETLVPMRYMNEDQHFKAISVSALCTVHYLNDSARLGWATRRAVKNITMVQSHFLPVARCLTALHKMVLRQNTWTKSGALL